MKSILILSILFFVTSCASGKICGGSGGKRCVETSTKVVPKTNT